MASSTKKSTMVKSVLSIQIVHYCCSNCGEEVEEMKVCRSCKAPMNVITVIQKYGEEAEKYLEELKGAQNVIKTDSNLDDIDSVSVDNSIVPDDDLEESGHVKHSKSNDFEKEFEIIANDEIFNLDDEDDEDNVKGKKKPVSNDDLAHDLDKLDEEETGTGLTDEDLKGFSEL